MSLQKISHLLNKYAASVPRYTSYPPIPFWKNKISDENWIHHIKQNYDANKGVDLYIHVPFCESLCYYCGCNRTITKDHSLEEGFLQALLAEWDLYLEKMELPIKVRSIHFGGGTPTFLSAKNLDRLLTVLGTHRTSEFLGSIEIDPRTCNNEHIQVLQNHHFKRVSLGIQDFDPSVQEAINRFQSAKMIEQLVSALKSHGVTSINFDLIYGLPKQNAKSIEHTMRLVSELAPDLIAFYSYAHLPHIIKNQRIIKQEDLPNLEMKNQLFVIGSNILCENGYLDIGMDHFALPDSYLTHAKRNNNLFRSFMGYTDKKSSILIGLGPTAISNSSISYQQNHKNTDDYMKSVSAKKLPTSIGYCLEDLDLSIQNVIQEIMCYHKVEMDKIRSLPFFTEINHDLNVFIKDEIIEISNETLHISEVGKPFIRNVAKTFDYHLRRQEGQKHFSSSI